jgi:hypothetical protein
VKRYCYFVAISLHSEIPPSRALYTLEKRDSYYERQINQTTLAPECEDHCVGAGSIAAGLSCAYLHSTTYIRPGDHRPAK